MSAIRPTVSVLVPTRDYKRPLEGLIKSFLDQCASGDELLIGIDTHNEPKENTEKIVRTIKKFYSKNIKMKEYDTGHNCWGHCILNDLMTMATGDYLVFIDDDDRLYPDALNTIRAVAIECGFEMLRCRCGEVIPARRVPFLFKVKVWERPMVYWFDKNVKDGGVGGHNLVVPNIPGRIGKWDCRYEGDYDFVASTLAQWAGVEWRGEFIMEIRVTGDYSTPPRR